MNENERNAGATAYPLQWPSGYPRTNRPERSRYRNTKFGGERDLLMYELRLFGGRNIVLSTNVPLRQDGLPYANFHTPDDKGVAVYFTRNENQYAFACDKWDKIEDNVKALRRTINAMRQLARDGVSEILDRTFHGFKAIPEKTGGLSWRTVLGFDEDYTPLGEELTQAYKNKLKIVHPDMPTGNKEQFLILEEAMKQAETRG